MSAQPQIGDLIDGRYKITRHIADGGMASVYQATDIRLERPVAVKIMHMQLAQGEHRDQFIERFHREARSAAKISNPHIVQIYDTGSYGDVEYLVMEYVHGITLRQEMSQRKTYNVREMLRIISGILEGLAAAHAAGVIHRDMKPENIMLTDRGRVRITDFGLAKATTQATLATTGMLLGTAGYLAPEMIENNLATAQGDIYSVGIMAWEMLTGQLPFQSESSVTVMFKHVHEDVPLLHTVDTRMPAAVSTLIGQLAARKMEQRPTDGTMALAAVKQCMQALTPDELAFQIGSDKQHFTSMLPPTPTAIQEHTQSTQEHTQSTHATQPNTIQLTTTPSTQEDTAAKHNSALNNTAQRKRKRILAASIAIACIVLLGIASAVWWTQLGPGSYWELPTASDISCTQSDQKSDTSNTAGNAGTSDASCTLTGASWKEYESTLKIAGIPYTAKQAYSDTVAKGNIISTDPANVGDHISKHGGSVTVTVSRGAREATIPSDIMQSGSSSNTKPLEALKQAGFDNIQHDTSTDKFSATVPEGALISISPEPGTKLKHNDAVTVVLSKGPQPVSMPDIIGKSWEEAKAALDEAQLEANRSEEYSDTVPKGSVISASQDPNAQLHWGDSVDVVISKGPKMVTIPSGLLGKNEKQVTQTLEDLGLTVQTNRILGGLFGTVRDITVDGKSVSDGGDVRLHTTDGKPTTVVLTIV